MIVELGSIALKGLGVGFQLAGKGIELFMFLLQSLATGAAKTFELLLMGMQKVNNAFAAVADVLGMKGAAASARAHSAELQKTIDGLTEFGKKKNKEIADSNKAAGESIGPAFERGSSAGSVAYHKLMAETEKANKKFREDVRNMTSDIPKLMEDAMKDFSDIFSRTLDQMSANADAANRARLEGLKQHLVNAQTEYTNHNTQVVVNETMTQEQRRAAFEAAAQASDNIAAESALNQIRTGEEYSKTRESQERNMQESRRNAIVQSGIVETDTDNTVTETVIANDGRVTTSTVSEVEIRKQALNTWIDKFQEVVAGVGGIAQAFGGMGEGVQNVLNSIGSGLTSLRSMLNATKGDILGIIAAGAGLGSTVTGLLGGNKQGGSIGGAIGGGIGTAIGGPVGGAIGGIIGGAIGGLFKGSKDPERLQANQEAYQRAMQGDRSAFDFLLAKSPKNQGGQGGWATDKAQQDAWNKYKAAVQNLVNTGNTQLLNSLPLLPPGINRSTVTSGRGVGMGTDFAADDPRSIWNAPYDPNNIPTISAPTLRTSVPTSSPTLSTSPTLQNQGGSIVVNQYGVTGTNVTQKTVSAISESLYKNYQQVAVLNGNTRLPAGV
jgi:hypothetical protein